MKLLCDCPFTHFEVNNPNGDVTFCSNHNMVLGNVNKNSLEEIWNGEAYKQVRQKFLDGKILEICPRNCAVLGGFKIWENIDWYKELPNESKAYKNAVLNEKEIAGGKVELTSRPRWLRFASSYACNLKCYHCFERVERKTALKLPDSFFEDVKKNVEAAQMVFFYGGEPLIENRNLDLMEYLSEKGYPTRVFLITNGTVLNEKIKSVLNKSNLGFMSVSVDSIRENLYEELRYPAKWRETREHLKFFSEVLKKKKGGMLMLLTINKKNQEEMLNFIKFSRELDAIPFFQFAHNAFDDEHFRKNYEIYSRREYRDVKKRLLEARVSSISADLPVTVKNIDYLLKFSMYHSVTVKKMKSFVSKKAPGLKRLLVKASRALKK